MNSSSLLIMLASNVMKRYQVGPIQAYSKRVYGVGVGIDAKMIMCVCLQV